MSETHDIAGLIKELRTSNDFKVRIDAAKSLADSGDPRSVDPLLDALVDHDEDVRCAVLKALAAIGDDAVASRIVMLLSDSEPKVRIEAIKTLFVLKAIDSIPEIYLRLKDQDWAVRNWASRTLHNFIDHLIAEATEDGIRLMIELLKTDEPTLRRKVEDSLIAEKSTFLPQLLEMLERGTSQQKKSISFILGKIGDKKALFPLINIIKDWDKEVRQALLRALGDLQDERAISPLIRTLGDANVEVRREAVRALTRFKAEAVLPLIRALIMSRDSYIRQNAAYALGEIGDQRSVSALLASLGDSYFLVRNAVEASLEKFGPAIATRLIRILTVTEKDRELANQLLGSHLANERLKGIELLAEIKDPASVKDLQKLLLDPYPRVQEEAQRVLFNLGCYAWARTGAARLLGQLRFEESEPTLIAALNDTDKDVRIEAIRALGLLRSNDAVRLIIPLLSDPVPHIRRVSAWTLGRIGHIDAVPALIEGILDSDTDMRLLSIIALGKLRDSRAVIPLMKLIASGSYRQKEAATNAIKTIGKPALPVVMKSIEEDHEMAHAIEEILQFMKDDFTEEMINEILPDLSDEQKSYFLKAIGRTVQES